MKFLNFLYQHINILSLDVVGGSVICSVFFARLMGVSLPPIALAVLALTVWIIYSIDHLHDAKMIPKIALTDRHRFHQTHFRALVLILSAAIAIDFIMIWFVPIQVRNSGFILGGVVFIYLLFQAYLKFLKEFFVAVLYTAGILLPSLAITELQITPLHVVVFGKFFITAMMNLLLFSLVDYKEDRHQRQHSFVTWFGPNSTQHGIILLGLLNILSGLWVWEADAGVALVFITMNVGLLCILLLRKELMKNNLYRILGDAVFFIPLFYLL